jgi:hypothetical protein
MVESLKRSCIALTLYMWKKKMRVKNLLKMLGSQDSRQNHIYIAFLVLKLYVIIPKDMGMQNFARSILPDLLTWATWQKRKQGLKPRNRKKQKWLNHDHQ